MYLNRESRPASRIAESNRRTFLGRLAAMAGALVAGSAAAQALKEQNAATGSGNPAAGASTSPSGAGPASASGSAGKPFQLPPLPYPTNALEPHIDAETMEIHHDRHHKAYVDKLNAAIVTQPSLAGKSIEELLSNLNAIPESIRNDVRNQGGGHMNHTMYWEIMTPGGAKQPSGDLAAAIDSAFGSFAKFQEEFNKAGEKRFGSGWSWLVLSSGGKLEVMSTANQDNPISDGHKPIMGNDVWEHAYYLKYRNKRADYLKAWWNVVNWDKVAERYQRAKG